MSAAGNAFGPSDAILPVVPMFHANAWGIPHAGLMVGAKLVFTGRDVSSPRRASGDHMLPDGRWLVL